MNKQPSKAIRDNSMIAVESAKFYDNFWNDFHKEPMGEQERARVSNIGQAISDFGNIGDLKILDLGCGRGWMAPYLAQFGTVSGIDFANTGIKFANENYGDYAQFYLADPQDKNLGLPVNELFDVVVCSEVIEHVEDHEALLTHIKLLLSPNGIGIFTTPNGNLWATCEDDDRFKNSFQPIENWLRPKEFKSLARQVGFVIQEHRGIAIHKIRFGWLAWLQHKVVQRMMKKIGLEKLLSHMVLPTSFYQLLVVQIVD